MKDPFKEIAEQAHFNIYHSDLWRGSGRRFAEMIVQRCASLCGSQVDKRNLLQSFGIPVESNVKYPAVEPSNSVESQYHRPLTLPPTIESNDKQNQ